MDIDALRDAFIKGTSIWATSNKGKELAKLKESRRPGIY